MRSRTRKLVGTVLMLVLVFVYFPLVAAFAPAILAPDNPWINLAFYAFAGLAWCFPAAILIKWMAKPDADGLQ